MSGVLFHVEQAIDRNAVIDGYVRSPMYTVIGEHAPAVLAVALLPLLAWGTLRSAARGGTTAARYLERYRRLPVVQRFLCWLLAVSATAHLGLVVGHEPSALSVLFIVDALVLFVVARRLLLGRRWRPWSGAALAASVLAYVVASVAGEPPDQVGIATKMVELTALGIVLTPAPEQRLRRLAGSAGMVALVVLTAIGAWIGAFRAGDGGHHLGEVPAPGVLLPGGVDRAPTASEAEGARRLYEATAAATARYADPTLAAADGYQTAGMAGTGFHASNAAYQHDGRILDPTRPETLVYAVGPSGPVLLGAMFEMPAIGKPGPAVGGPLTVWHAHDHVCFSLLPPALSGLSSPYGTCPLGSITVPITPEMIHVWTVPGAPEPFGDLDDEWLARFLAGH